MIPTTRAKKGVYHHVPREVWYTSNDTTGYRVCDGSGEDLSCQDSVAPELLTWHDLDLYLGHAMWCCSGKEANNQACAFPFPNFPNGTSARGRGTGSPRGRLRVET